MTDFNNDYEKLLKIESKYDLYSYQMEGEYVWPYLRNKVYGLIHRKNVLSTSTNINKFDYNSFNKNELFSYVEDSRDAIVFNFSRKELGPEGIVYDERTSRLKSQLAANNISFYEVDFNQEGLYQTNYGDVYNCSDINYFYEKYKPDRLLKYDNNFIEMISKEISSQININFNIKDYLIEITKKIDVFHTIFYEMFLKLKPKYIFITSNYMMNEIIIPAKKLNIPVYEIQYAAITSLHNGYHYNNAVVPTYPDGILTWGKYWSNFNRFPSNLSYISEIGSNKKFNLRNKHKNKVSVISQNLMSQEIVSTAIDLALKNRDYDFKLRLHPNEELSTDLVKKIDEIDNITFDSDSLEYTLSTSEYIVGVSSTVLFEAIHYDCKLLIINAYMSSFVKDLISNKYAYYLTDYSISNYDEYEFNVNKNFYEDANIDFSALKKSNIENQTNTKMLDELYQFNMQLIKDNKLIDVSQYSKYLEDKKKLLTIIVPNYNGGEKLKRTLNSVSFSEYKDLYSVYLVDDCSTDNSLSGLEKYEKDIDFTILSTNKNTGGPGKPRQIGIDNSKTKYIYFLDNDDVLNFRVLLKSLFLMDSMNLDYIRMSNVVKFSDKIFRFETNGSTYYDLLFNAPFLWNGIYRSDLIKEKNIKMRCGIAEDFNFNAKYLNNCKKIINFKEDILIYFKEDSNISLDMSFESINKLLDNHIDTSEYLANNTDKKIIKRYFQKTIKEFLLYNTSFEYLVDKFMKEEQDIINKKIGMIFQNLEKKVRINERFYDKINQEFTNIRISEINFEETSLILSFEQLRNVELKRDYYIKVNGKTMDSKEVKFDARFSPYIVKAKYANENIKFRDKRVFYDIVSMNGNKYSIVILNYSKLIYIRVKKEKHELSITFKNKIYINLVGKLKKIILRIKNG